MKHCSHRHTTIDNDFQTLVPLLKADQMFLYWLVLASNSYKADWLILCWNMAPVNWHDIFVCPWKRFWIVCSLCNVSLVHSSKRTVTVPESWEWNCIRSVFASRWLRRFCPGCINLSSAYNIVTTMSEDIDPCDILLSCVRIQECIVTLSPFQGIPASFNTAMQIEGLGMRLCRQPAYVWTQTPSGYVGGVALNAAHGGSHALQSTQSCIVQNGTTHLIGVVLMRVTHLEDPRRDALALPTIVPPSHSSYWPPVGSRPTSVNFDVIVMVTAHLTAALSIFMHWQQCEWLTWLCMHTWPLCTAFSSQRSFGDSKACRSWQ